MDAKETIAKALWLIQASGLTDDDKALMLSALEFHGHVCPAMPAAFRAGRLAMRTLGIGRERNSVSRVYAEVGRHQAAACFVDGLQSATGCTFGKNNIYKLEYGKWAFTLVAKDNSAIRVSVKSEVMEKNFSSGFIEQRKKGVLPSQVSSEIALEIFEATLARSDQEFFNVGEIFKYEDKTRKIETCFYAIRCQNCGELIAENYVRYKQGKLLCIPCSGYEK